MTASASVPPGAPTGAPTGAPPGAPRADRPPDPAGLHRHRVRWLSLAWCLVLADGEELEVRGARRADLDVLALLHGRCSAETTRARYGVPMTRVPTSVLRRALTSELCVVALSGSTRAVALASLARLRPDRDGARDTGRDGGRDGGRDTGRDTGIAEVAVIVEDAYQRRGIGTALASYLAGAARLVGYRRLHAPLAPGGAVDPGVLGPLGLSRVTEGYDGLVAALGPAALAALPGPGARVSAPTSGPDREPIPGRIPSRRHAGPPVGGGSAAGELGLARPPLHERAHADLPVLSREQADEQLTLDLQTGRQFRVEPPVDRLLRGS